MPMKCMAQTPQPSARLPVSSVMPRSEPLASLLPLPAICSPIQDEKMATSTDRITSAGS